MFKARSLARAKAKAQSAMEYLMTYGWAILIIAVVLGALFQLGVFNANNFAPKAPPGACQVFRPNGPGTTSFINLEGECQGELPEYVAQFNGGKTTNISIAHKSFPQVGVSITAWIYTPSPSNWQVIFSNGQYDWAGGISWQLGICYGGACVETPNVQGGGIYSSLPIPQNTWVFEAATIAPGSSSGSAIYYAYVNNQYQTVTASAPDPNTQNWLYIGTGFNQNPMVQFQTFSGMIANIQVYNTTLSPSEIQALYQEGIGGAPIDLQHLVGWWPLNGNANDYSGNGNNGVPNGVTFTSNWWSGYTPP
jgi:hypothetical protein